MDQLVLHFGEKVYLLFNGDGFLELVICACWSLVYILMQMIILFVYAEHGLIGGAADLGKTSREFIDGVFVGTGLLGELENDGG